MSNTLQPTYPDGLDVEVIRPTALRWVAEHSSDPAEGERETLSVYRRLDRFRTGSGAGDKDISVLRCTVDDAANLAFVLRVCERAYPAEPDFELQGILAVLEAEPGLAWVFADAKRNAALGGLDTGAIRHSFQCVIAPVGSP